MSTSNRGISIIMTVYDQARELESNLPLFLSQEYEADYEVIVVDETSTDNTEDVLKLLKKDYPHLYTTFLPKPNRHVTRKKLAFSIGTNDAKNELIMFSRIDRTITAPDILKAISEVLDENAELTLGYIGRKGIRLQSFAFVDSAASHIRKAERRLKKVVDRDTRMSYAWGRYDFIIIHKKNVLDLLNLFEQHISPTALLGIRLSILWQSLIKRSSTTLLVTE